MAAPPPRRPGPPKPGAPKGAPKPAARPAPAKERASTTTPLKPAATPAKSPPAARPSRPARTPPSGRRPPGPGRPEGAKGPAAPRLPRGMGVRAKVVLSTAAIVVTAGVISFVFVFYNTQQRINKEINLKGAQLVDEMRSIPAAYWLEFCRMEDLDNLHGKLVTFIEQFGPPNWREKTGENAAWVEMEAESIKPDWGKYQDYADLKILEERLRAVLQAFWGAPDWFENLSDQRKANWAPAIGAFQIPFGRLPILQEFGKKEDNRDVLMLTVVPREVPGVTRSVQSGPAENASLTDTSPLPPMGDIEVIDGSVREAPARAFKHRQDLGAGKGAIDYYAILSLAELQRAKIELLWVVVGPILVSILLGVGVAYAVGSRLTRPLSVLMQDIRTVSAGDLEHETVPQSADEIGQLAVTFNGMTAELREAHQNELAKKALEHELSIATDIQANLLPKSIPRPPGLDIGAYYRPSKEVGGDYYDFIMIDDENMGIIVADVSGKGVPGSLVMTKTQTLIRMEADRGGDKSPSETLKHVNRLLARDIRKGMFVTALYGVLNLKSFELAVCSAGHNPLFVFRAATGKVDQVNPSGIALGFDKGPLFNRSIKEEKITLAPGDRLVAYTDGVVESMNEANEEYGDERFVAQIQKLAPKPANEFVSSIAQQLDAFKGAAEQHDDITLVTVKRV